MNDPLQLGTVGLVIGALIAAAKLIEWVHKSDLKAIGQFGRWGAVGLFALSVPLLFGLLMNRRWTEAIGLSAVILVAFAVYGPRILGQLRPRPPVAAQPGGSGKRAEHKVPADAAATEAEMVQGAIAVLEEYLRRKTGVAEQAPDARATTSRITHGRSEGVREGRRQGNGDHLELPSPPPLSEGEALSVLGLAPGAAESEIHEAHRRLIQMFHPDRGGSEYFAVKLNRAKEVLLERPAKSSPESSAGARKRTKRDTGQADSPRSRSNGR